MIATRAPCCFRGGDQIRPELQLGEHQQRRPHAAHGGSHGPAEIERAVEHGEVGVFLAGQLVAGAAGRRDDELPIGMRGSQFAQQRGEQIHFADADGVNPDARRVAVAPRHQAEKLFAIAFAVLAGAQRLPDDQRRADREHRQIDDVQKPGEKSRHAGILSQLTMQFVISTIRGHRSARQDIDRLRFTAGDFTK